MKTEPRRRARLLGALVVAALVAGCGSSTHHRSATTGAGAPKDAALDPHAAALLPKSIKAAGVLVDGVSAAFPPFEYYSPSHQIIGMDIDLANALARVLGVRLEVRNTGFPSLIPGVQSGRYEISQSGLDDTKTREDQVSFVEYLTDGTTLLVPTGDPHHLTISGLCGQKVAVTTASSEALVTVPLLNKKCAAEGKPPLTLLNVPEASDPMVALSSRRAVGALVDTVAAVTAAKSAAAHVAVAPGPSFNTTPMGIAVGKNSGSLPDALKVAVDDIIKNGTYAAILKKWGFTQIGVKSSGINLVG